MSTKNNTAPARLKVMTVVGTRPEIIKLSATIKLLDEHVNHVLVHTGQNYDYELNEIFFKDLGLRRPDYFLKAAGRSSVDTISKVLTKIDPVLEKENPDAFLILGDTNSCYAALAAKRRKIPIFHMEAGNRCFDQRVPEEVNRKLIDHLSDINMPYSAIAREYLIREGFPADRIIKTGSPMREVLKASDWGRYSDIRRKLFGKKQQEYIVVSVHREENVDNPKKLMEFAALLEWLATTQKSAVVLSLHPRTRKRLSSAGIELHRKIIQLKPLGFNDYIYLQKNAACVLSDSGTLTEEAAILGLTAVNLREAHERPEGAEAGTTVMAGFSIPKVNAAINAMSSITAPAPVKDYEDSNVSLKVLRTILSYTEYVNQNVWHKQ